jgi:hypothetical protein
MTGLLAGPIGSLLQGAAGTITGLVDFSVTSNLSDVSGITAPVPSAALSGDLLVTFALHSSGGATWSGSGWTQRAQTSGRYLSSRTWDGANNNYSFTSNRFANKTLVMLVFRGYSFGATSAIPTSGATFAQAVSFTIPANNSLVIGVPYSAEAGQNYTKSSDSGSASAWTKMLENTTSTSINIWKKLALQSSGVSGTATWNRSVGSSSGNAAIQFSLSPV